MKKTYNIPQLEIVSIKTSLILNASPVTLSPGSTPISDPGGFGAHESDEDFD